MYSNNQNRGRSVPGRKKRRDTFTAKELDPRAPRSPTMENKPRRRARASASPIGRRAASPSGRRTSSVGRRTPTNSNNTEKGRRKPRTSVNGTTPLPREFRSEEFRPAKSKSPSRQNTPTRPRRASTHTTTTKTTTTTTKTCKPTTQKRQSRLSGFTLTCHVEGCDGGPNCLHI